LTLIEDRDPSAKLIATGAQIFKDQPGSVLGIYQPQRQGRRQLAETLVRLVKRATDLIKTDPKKAAIPVFRALGAGIVPLAVFERAMISPSSHFISNPAQILEATAEMQDYQVKIGVLKHAVPVDQAFDLSIFRNNL